MARQIDEKIAPFRGSRRRDRFEPSRWNVLRRGIGRVRIDARVLVGFVAAMFAVAAAQAATNVVQYTYDAAGNIVAIGRGAGSAVSIAGFAPTGGPIGTAVAISGTGFSPATAGNGVAFNGVPAQVTAATATLLTATVPPGATTGRIVVSVPGAQATSAQDFAVTFPGVPTIGGIAATDIVASTRLAINGPAQSIGLFAFNKVGLILFDGKPGDWLSLQLGNFVINPAGAAISYSIYRPDNTQISTGSLTAGNLTIHVPPLPTTGTYAVVLRSGSTQVSLDARLESNRALPVDGSTIAVSRGTGQSTRALVAAVAGEQKALMVAAMANAPAGTNLNYELATPTGAVIRRGTAYGMGGTDWLPPFATTGTYTVTLTPGTFATQTSYQLALLAGVSVPVDGAAPTVPISLTGAGARLNFAGTAGDNLGFGITGVAPDSPPTVGGTFYVYRPDGNLLASANCAITGGPCSVNLANLPVTGNYVVIVAPWNGGTGTLRAWLSRDLAGSLASGAPMAVALARPGQNARLAFSGTAGALVALQVRRIVTAPVNQPLTVQVNRPDGTRHGYAIVPGSGETLVLPSLPATGTYTVFIEPDAGSAQGAATATMEVLLDPGQSLAIDAPTVTSTIAVAGASARYTFTGTAGQSLGLGIGNLALGNGSDASVSIYKPDGLLLASATCTGSIGRCDSNLTKLTASGTYQVVVRPAYGAVGTFGATLSTDLVGTIAIGSAQPLTLDRPGQNARLAFAGVSGQLLRLSWSGISIAGANLYSYAYLLRPDGSTLKGTSFFNGAAGGIDWPALPATGTYTIFVDPVYGTTMNATLMVTAR